MEKINNYKFFTIILIIFTFLYFLTGFYLDENAAGAGTYGGDFDFIWANLQIFKNHDLISAIQHPDYFTNRPPLLYVLHSLFNPFLDNPVEYRRTVFAISLAGPVLFYFCLKQRFEKADNVLLLLIALTICLSPYYRTTAYWGLEENYAIITLLLSLLSLNSLLKNKNNYGFKIYSQLFFTTLFSSCCVYFDQKFIIIPIICFFTIVTSEKLIKFKILLFILYLIFSLPFIYLMIFWGGVISTATAVSNINSITTFERLGKIYPVQVGYAASIIALYLLPLLLFKNKNLYNLIKDFFLNKKNYYFISLFFIYLFYLLNFADLAATTGEYWMGLGYAHKISLFLFKNSFFREIFIYFVFFISWIVILIYIDKNLKDGLIIFYFLVLALHLWPLMHEYFDPMILLMAFTFFNTKLFINYKNTIFLSLYLLAFLLTALFYYTFIPLYPVG